MADKYTNELNTISAVADADLMIIEDGDAPTDLKNMTVATLKTFMQSAYTASRAMETNGSGVLGVSAITSTELGYLNNLDVNLKTHVDDVDAHHTESHAFTSHTGETIDPTPTDNDVIYADSGAWTSGTLANAGIYAVADKEHQMASTADHTATQYKVFSSNVSGDVIEKTIGATNTVLQGVSGTALTFAQLTHAQLSGVTSDLHHNKQHGIASGTEHDKTTSWRLIGSDDSGVVEVAFSANAYPLVSNNATTMPSFKQINHNAISDFDSAVNALIDTKIGTHADITGAHHAQSHTLGSHSDVGSSASPGSEGETLEWSSGAWEAV